MRMKTIALTTIAASIILSSSFAIAGTKPIFTIIPTTPTTIELPRNGTVRVEYIVTNQTKHTRTLTIRPILGVTQVTDPGYCSSPFVLASLQSCTLALNISGLALNSANQTHIKQGPVVCKTKAPNDPSADPFLCAQPSETNRLNVAVTSARVTVGNMTTPTNRFPLVYTGRGDTFWSEAILLTPPVGGTLNNLSSVACDTSGLLCLAVGNSTIAGLVRPIAYTSIDGGNNWSGPTFPGIPASGTANNINNNACSADGLQCLLVGTTTIAALVRPLVYTTTDGGNTWSTPITTLAVPSGGTNNNLFGVSCDATGLICTTVGVTTIAATGRPLIYTSTNGGNSWSSPNALTVPVGWNVNGLTSVYCDVATGTHCVAAGSVTISGLRVPLTYRTIDGGLNWVSTLPPAPPTATQSLLRSVTCDSEALNCVTVGSAIISGVRVPLSYTSNDGGVTWPNSTILTTPTPGFNNFLTAVSCDATGTQCTNVGNYTAINAANPTIPLSYFSNDGGDSWSDPIFPPFAPTATAGGLNMVFVGK